MFDTANTTGERPYEASDEAYEEAYDEGFEGSWSMAATHTHRQALDEQYLAWLEEVAHLDAIAAYRRDGYTSTTAFMVHRCGVTVGDAHRDVALARTLGDVPHATTALRAGAISLAQLRLLADMARRHPAEFTDAEPHLTETVTGLTPQETARALAYWSQSVCGPDDLPDEPEPSTMFFSRTTGGDADIAGRLDENDADVVAAALDALMTADVRSEPDVGLGRRTPSQRRADALVELALRFLHSGDGPTRHGQRPHVSVVVDHDVLTLRDVGGTCETTHGHVIHPHTARRYACHSHVTRIVRDADSDVVDVGRTHRTVTAAQWKALAVRDRHCSFPGCSRPPDWCDAHHREHWADGGATDLDNLHLLCRRHHVLVHEGGFTMTIEDGALVFRRPDGTELPGRAPP